MRKERTQPKTFGRHGATSACCVGKDKITPIDEGLQVKEWYKISSFNVQRDWSVPIYVPELSSGG